MTKMSGPEKTISESAPRKEISCAKCGHHSPAGSSTCKSCGAHLYIVCHSCGHRTLRAHSKCSECGQRLHRSWWQRTQRRVFGKQGKLGLVQVILLLISIVVAWAVIKFFAEWKQPEPESYNAPLLPTELTRHA